jgi:hypothetical protein
MTSEDMSSFVEPHLKLSLPIGYYNVPDHCAAIFSTKNGSVPKRRLPQSPSPRLVYDDRNEAIRSKVKQLREAFPAITSSIAHPPTTWFDLYKFFDGVDLWHEGPPFLFYVINHISRENTVMAQRTEAAKVDEIRKWAKHWMDEHGPRVMNLPVSQDLIDIFNDVEQECIKGMARKDLVTLRNELNALRNAFVSTLPSVDGPRLFVPPQHGQQTPRAAQAQPYIPAQHPLQHGQPIMRGPPMQYGPSMGPRGLQMLPEEARRQPMMNSKIQPQC